MKPQYLYRSITFDHDMAREILRDKRFGAGVPTVLAPRLIRRVLHRRPVPPNPVDPPSMLVIDQPEHARMRKPVGELDRQGHHLAAASPTRSVESIARRTGAVAQCGRGNPADRSAGADHRPHPTYNAGDRRCPTSRGFDRGALIGRRGFIAMPFLWGMAQGV